MRQPSPQRPQGLPGLGKLRGGCGVGGKGGSQKAFQKR